MMARFELFVLLAAFQHVIESSALSSTPTQTAMAPVTPSPEPYWIYTVAGTPGVDSSTGDGLPGTSGTLGFPYQMSADGAGGFVFGEVHANLIRRLSANGTLETLVRGVTSPYGGAAPDGDGGFYVAASDDYMLFRISASGTLRAFAGYSGRTFGLCPDGNGGVYIGTLSNYGRSACSRMQTSAKIQAPPPPSSLPFAVMHLFANGTTTLYAGIPELQGYSGDGGLAY